MNDAIRSMLREYGAIKNSTDEINALREIVQRVTLLGLHRSGFFDEASFYGGTALRLLYNLDRFSEDMDFCLNNPDPKFSFAPFFKSIAAELERFGLEASLEEKKYRTRSVHRVSFCKTEHLQRTPAHRWCELKNPQRPTYKSAP